jgi:hypothetical protein
MTPSSSTPSSGLGSCQARLAYPELIAGGGGVLPSTRPEPGVSGDREVREREEELTRGCVGEGMMKGQGESKVVADRNWMKRR